MTPPSVRTAMLDRAPMDEHVHGCLNCRPDMVPDFDRADPCYHRFDKCGMDAAHGAAMVNGAPLAWTAGVFEGPEGWALFVGAAIDDIHSCPTCSPDGRPQYICAEPRFGHVTIACPARGDVV